MEQADLKRSLGCAAVDALVRSGMKLGLGTGSTAITVLWRLETLRREGALRDLLLVPSSFQTEIECWHLGLPLASLNDSRLDGRLDLTIDGADEVDPDWNLIKGGGGAMLMEKIVAQASKSYAIVVDGSKLVSRLGQRFPVPVEVLPEALTAASRQLEALGAAVELRQAQRKAGPVVTDHGNLILDARFQAPFDPRQLESAIKEISGVLACGIFTRKVTDLFVGFPDGRIEHSRR